MLHNYPLPSQRPSEASEKCFQTKQQNPSQVDRKAAQLIRSLPMHIPLPTRGNFRGAPKHQRRGHDSLQTGTPEPMGLSNF